MAEVDEILRAVTRLFPEELVRALTHPGAMVRDVRWLETQFAARERRLDRVLSADVDGVVTLHFVEWAWRWTRHIPWRMFEYHALLALASRDAKTGALPPMRGTVVVLTGGTRLPTDGVYRTSAADSPFSGVRFGIDVLRRQRIADLRDRGSDLWLAFAPLARDATVEAVVEVAQDLVARSKDPARTADLAAMLEVLALRAFPALAVDRRLIDVLPKELTMRSHIYDMGRDEGRVQGRVEGLLHQVARRLGRVPSATERASIVRVATTSEGAERLADAVLDLHGADLAAWLAAAGH